MSRDSTDLIAQIFSLLDRSDAELVKIARDNTRLSGALYECENEKARALSECESARIRLTAIEREIDARETENKFLVSTLAERDSEIRHLRSLLSLWPARLMLKTMRHIASIKSGFSRR